MKGVLIKLTLRDIRSALSFRTLLIWIVMAGMAVFFFFTSAGRTELVKENKVEFMTLFLPQIIFGAWAVLSVYFDLVSSDREHNVLDCILCSGVTKKQVFTAKIITTAVVSLLLSFIYLFPITAVIVSLSDFSKAMLLIRYLLPLWGYIMVFAAVGATISVLARSSKAALIWSLAAGLILMPRFFMIIVEGLGSVFHWSHAAKDSVSMIAPGVLMNALADFENTTNLLNAVIGFSAGVLILFTISYLAFCRQDEYNYGE
jgi:ABC-type transport system involved in multi-copper enzyme maturation permease subunit